MYRGILYLLLCGLSFAIIDPNENNQKPAYTSGIKTSGWVRPSGIQVHHNYSRVSVQHSNSLNNDIGTHYITEKFITNQGGQKLTPVYNGHSYGNVVREEKTLVSKNNQNNHTAIYKVKKEIKHHIEVYTKCPKHATGQFIHQSSCNQFLNCWKGRGFVQTCPPGTLFNPKTLECDFANKVECITGPSNLVDYRPQRNIKQATCPPGFIGLIPDYTNCAKFINCNSGFTNRMDCPPGTLFDIKRNVCDHPWAATCFNGENTEDATNQQGGGYHIQGSASSNNYNYVQNGHHIENGHTSQQNGQYVQTGHASQGHGHFLSLDQLSSAQTQSANSRSHLQGDYGPNLHGGVSVSQQYVSSSSQVGQPCLLSSQGQSNPQAASQTGQNQGITLMCVPVNQLNTYGGSVQGKDGTLNSQTSQQNIAGGFQTYHQPCQGSICRNQNTGGGYSGNTAQGQAYYGQQSNSYDTQGSTILPQSCQGSSCGQQNIDGASTNRNTQTQSQFGRRNENNNQGCQGNVCLLNPSHTTETSSNDQNTLTGINQGGVYGIMVPVQLVPCQGNSCNRQHFVPIAQSGSYGGQTTGSVSQTNQGGISGSRLNSETGENRGQLSPTGSGSYGFSQIQPGGYLNGQNMGVFTSYQSNTGYQSQPNFVAGHGSGYNWQVVAQNSSHTVSSIGQTQNNGPNGVVLGYGRVDHGTQNSGQDRVQSSFGGSGSQTIRGFSQTAPHNYHNGQNTGLNTMHTSNADWGSVHTTGTLHQGSYGPSTNDQGTTTNQSGRPKCPDSASGLYPHPSDCSKFLNCDNGRTFIQDCAPGTLFNPSLKVCDFPYNVDCSHSATSEGQTSKIGTDNVNTGNEFYGVSSTANYEYVTNYKQDIVSKVTQTQHGDSTYDWDQRVDQKINWGGGANNVDGISTRLVNTNSFTPRSDQIPVFVTSTSRPYLTVTSTRGGWYSSSARPIKNNDQNVDQFPDQFDYDDTFGTSRKVSSTPQSLEDTWPPPYPSTDINADYVFEYEDGEEVTLKPANPKNEYEKNRNGCWRDDFHCSVDKCIPKIKVCNGIQDCPDGRDETSCKEFVAKFNYYQNARLTVLEKERWDNISSSTCALLCLETPKFECKAFNFRKIDKACFLTDQNIGMSGALISYYPNDYYELKSTTVDCSNKFKCGNKKCIDFSKVCDGTDDCGDRMDEKNCNAEDFGYSIRLAGSASKNEGRIEVAAFGKTGYICDDSFGINSANVVCKELGFPLGAADVKKNSYYSKEMPSTNILYMMDDVFCLGNETSLRDCDFSGWGIHNCREEEVVGVVCKTPLEKCPENFWQCQTGNECVPLPFVCDGLLDCSDNSDEGEDLCEAIVEIRLINGSSSSEGRLEIKHNGIWGTVCDDDFNEDAAKVVCKSLGYRGSSVVKKDGYFGKGSGPIWLDQVFCRGNESSVDECQHWDWGEHNCEHAEDVGIECSDDYTPVIPKHVPSSNPDNTVNYPLYPDTCGMKKDNIFLFGGDIHARVIKGTSAQAGDYPWQAAIRMKGHGDKSAHWCGAIIISERWILTAAHCLEGYPKGAYIIVAGDYDIENDEGTEQHSFIEDYYIHEDFRKGHKMNNDIALIKLKGQGFRLNQDIQAICLPDTDLNYSQELNCTISGFGTLRSGSAAYSKDLKAAWIPVLTDNVCTMPHVYGDHLTDNMFCAGFLEGGIDACDGDSGGPLACLDNGHFTLYGIISWGQHCGYANRPGVYVKVAKYRDWIEEKMKEYSNK